ncbi:hypothetical protein RRG08_034478 [Elysia crispata]|uniref:RZZ complex subunit KNTC1/ROD C-terminal domain-containing protein n=1 Tax=Elysia crispata TaxID=231223 RepID=A0AAE0ZH08_9GAST|nr:hypothetical protein RRG08_034478 [Elysia crispata]
MWHVSTSDTTAYTSYDREQQETVLLKLISENAPPEVCVLSSAIGTFTAVAIDKQLIVLREQSVSCTFFKSIIDDFALLEGGYIVVAERNGLISLGTVHGDRFTVTQANVRLPHTHKDNPLHGDRFTVTQANVRLPHTHKDNPLHGDRFTVTQANRLCQASAEGQTYCRVLFQEEPSHAEGDQQRSKVKVLAMTSQCELVVCSNMSLQDGDIDLSEIEIQRLSTPPGFVLDMAVAKDMIIAVGPDCLWVASEVEGELVLEANLSEMVLESTLSTDDLKGVKMIKVQYCLDAPFFITMDALGQFYLWDCLTLTIMHTWHIRGVLDFRVIVEQKSFSSLQELQLLVLRDSEILTVTLPSLTPKLTYKLADTPASLTRCPITQDDILVAEKKIVEDFVEVETHVSVRLYTESSPQKRLMRLLSRHRFEEAEALAKLYGLKYELDPSIIQSLMNERKDTFVEMMEHLDSCRQKLLKNKSNELNVKIVLSELDEIQHRLNAYDQVFGRENYSREEWDMFQAENPLRLCVMLSGRDPNKAFTLWGCFQSKIKKELRPGVLGQVLMSLPQDVPPGRVVDWLCDLVVPVACGVDHEAVARITDWVNTCIEHMEELGEPEWISSAATIVTTLLASLETACRCSVDDLRLQGEEVVKAKLSNTNFLKPLRTLVCSLEELGELGSKFNFHIPLHRLQQESKESLAMCMLSRVPAASLLPAALRETILPFIRSRQLVVDEILARYVEHLIQHHENLLRANRGDSKEMVKAVIESITSPKEKVAATQNLCKNLKFPLPDFVSELVEDIINNVKHSSCASLKEQWALKEAGNIMWNIGINASDVNTSHDVVDTAKYLLSCDQPLSHAQKVLIAFGEAHRESEVLAYACRLKVERDQLDALVNFIGDLPQKSAIKCCQFVLYSAKHLSVEGLPHTLAEEMRAKQMLYYEAALRVSSVLLSLLDDNVSKMEVQEQMACISKIKNLQLHHGLSVSEATLADKSQCLALFAQVSRQNKGFDLLRLSKLLSLRNDELIQSLLANFADRARENQYPDVEKIIRLMSHCCRGVSLPEASVHSVLDLLERPCDDFHQMVSICLRLTAELATHCAPEREFAKVVQVSHLLQLIRAVCRLDQAENTTLQAEAVAWDPLVGAEVIKSDDSGKVLASLAHIGTMYIKDSWSDDLVSSCVALVDSLTQRGRRLLALRVMNFLKHAVAGDSAGCKAFMDLEKNISASLVKKHLQSREGSLMLGLAASLKLRQQESIGLIKSILKACGTDYKQLKRVSAVAGAYAELVGDESLVESCSSVKTIAKWGVRLAKIGISFKASNKLDALNKLVVSRYCTVDIVQEFYKDFKLERACLESHLALYLQHFLPHHSELSLPVQLQAKEILTRMLDPLPLLKKLLQKTSPYDYTKLQFLLEEMQQRCGGGDTERGLQLLRYLDKYTRNCPPSEDERQKCGGSSLVDAEIVAGAEDVGIPNILPKESVSRLPYHMLMSSDAMTVIKNEVGTESLDAWLNMAHVLKIPRDNILLRAVINIMEKYISSQNSSPTSATARALTPSSSAQVPAAVSEEFLTLLASVGRVMMMFKKKEHVVWCSNSMLQKLQNVEEKKLALKSCITFTQNWLESTEEGEDRSSVQTALNMFKKRLLVLSTHVALARAGLLEPLGSAAKQDGGDKMIRAIYGLTSDILEKATDVNGAVDTIGDLNHVNVEQLRVSLLEEWLSAGSGDMTVDLEQTMTFDVTVCPSETDESEIISKVMLLLQSSSRETCMEKLEEIVAEGCLSDPKGQVRASFCLLQSQYQ